MEQPAAAHLWSLNLGEEGWISTDSLIVDTQGRCYVDENAVVWLARDGDVLLHVRRNHHTVEVSFERARIGEPWALHRVWDRWRLTPVVLLVDGEKQPVMPAGLSEDVTALLPADLRGGLSPFPFGPGAERENRGVG